MKIVKAIRGSKILLDVPFKSLDEVVAMRGENEVTRMYANRAAKHGILSPLKTLAKLKDLEMTFLLFFTQDDQEFSNQLDSEFAKNLLEANTDGTNIILSADNGKHSDTHPLLWQAYNL